MTRTLLTLAVALLAAVPADAQNVGSYGKAPLPGDRGAVIPDDVEYEQKLGAVVPLDLELYDHHAAPVTLRQVTAGKPTVLVMAYMRCPRLCNEVLTRLLDSLKEVRRRDPSFVAGGPFNVVVVSVDPKDPPPQMAKRRAEFGREYDGRDEGVPGVWFLTASRGQGTDLAEADAKVHEVAAAAGFHYKLYAKGKNHAYDPAGRRWVADDGKVLADAGRNYDYQHAAGVVFLSPDGKVTRYLLGLDYPPAVVRQAVVEASAGTVGSLADKVVLYCFAYDTASGHYRPTMRALGVVAAPFVLLLGFLVYRTVRRDPTPPAPPLGRGPVNFVAEDRRP
ncbi:MAG: SCO family protein [Gemmataceae bacterium]